MDLASGSPKSRQDATRDRAGKCEGVSRRPRAIAGMREHEDLKGRPAEQRLRPILARQLEGAECR